MEIHQHTHHSPRKWTHYLWEFLMLFLAVFCGFLAENLREHQVEHQKERQLMQSLLSDLKADTATLHFSIPKKKDRIKAIDSVFMYFNEHKDVRTISGNLFKSIRRTVWDQRFNRNDVTINQLKNAGGMRMVRKTVADSISEYDLLWEQTSLFYELYIADSQTGNRQMEELFDAADLLPLYITNQSIAIVNNIPDTLTVRINTNGLNQMLNFMMLEKVYAQQEINRSNIIIKKAIGLMALIKKEYRLH